MKYTEKTFYSRDGTFAYQIEVFEIEHKVEFIQVVKTVSSPTSYDREGFYGWLCLFKEEIK